MLDEARHDPAVFTALLLDFDNTEFHDEWHDAITDNERTLIFTPIEHGKTQQIAIGRTLYEIGRNHTFGNRDFSGAILGAVDYQPKKSLAAIRSHIESNPRFHMIFPSVVKGNLWTTEQINIKGRRAGLADPTLVVGGMSLSSPSSRWHWLSVDDPLNFTNTFTQAQCDKIMSLYQSQHINRVLPGGKIVITTTAWHEGDMAHQIERNEKSEQSAGNPERYRILHYRAVYEDGRILWPERWDEQRLEEKRRDIGALEFMRAMLCKAAGDEFRVFKRTSLQAAMALAKANGTVWGKMPFGATPIAGIDLAVKKGREHDKTSILTAGLKKNNNRAIVDILTAQMSGVDIVNEIVAKENFWGWVRAIVEDNAAQDYIRQWAKHAGASRVVGYTTGREKYDPNIGLQGLATEIDSGMWEIPESEESMQLIENLLNYSPSDHTPDNVMAMWFASIAAKEVGRRGSAAILNRGEGSTKARPMSGRLKKVDW